MRLAISVIAWDPDDDAAVVDRLASDLDGLEVAPTRIWASWDEATPDAAARWRDELEPRGLVVPALQSLLFGVEGASVTGDSQARRTASDHLCAVASIAGALRAHVAVFGSPGSRRRGDLSHEEATRRMREALLPAADAFADKGSAIGIEANPPEYGCDFLTTYAEAAEFVDRMAHPGIVRHLDTGQLLLSGEDPVLDGQPPSHVHLSAPSLAPFRAEPADWHAELVGRLRAAGYDGWVSIEERPEPDGLDGVASAVRAARALLEGA